MFDHLSVYPKVEEVEDAFEKVRFNRIVKFKEYKVKTLDLGDPSQEKEYIALMSELMQGVQAKTHVLFCNERRPVEFNGVVKWFVHLEWAVFELEVKPITPLGKDLNNGQ